MSPARCVILVPHQGRIVTQCQTALLELERRGYAVRRVEGFSAIDAARNQIASDALRDGFQETLWIDSDVGFESDAVDRLRRHGLPITCGIYPKKGLRELAMHVLPGTERFRFGVHGGLSEILYAGAGFLHIRREVYETIAQTLSLPVCNQHAGRPLWPFFQPLIRSAPRRAGAIEDSDPATRRTGRFSTAIDEFGTAEAIRHMEIEAAERLIQNRQSWQIPNSETRQTIQRLRGLRNE